MKVLYQWLREFVPTDLSPTQMADTLSRLGFEIASVEEYGKHINNVIVAHVREVAKHPNADRLSLCQVDTGEKVVPVVCGAANVRAGIKVAFAQVGATLPPGEILKAAKIRGVESQGMICSAAELGLEEKSDGILILDDQASVGEDIRKTLALDDALIDIETTPNRRDVLGVLGVARELAAGLNLPLKYPEPHPRQIDLPKEALNVVNEAPAHCSRYVARYSRDVKVAPSPVWLTRRLARCGIRSINNIVDVTNYVMLELGQPLHAFDAATLAGHEIRIRLARQTEHLHTLEGKDAALKPDMLIIADAEKPVALAGIMGGQDSSIRGTTTEIVLESAAFTPHTIRRTGRALGIRTESSYRFERGSDLQMVAFASRRAAQLIQELAGGLGGKPVEASAAPVPAIVVKLRTDRMRAYLGADIKDAQAADYLRRLGCIISSGIGQMAVTVPAWRLDITDETDLYEEIARLYGYDQIPTRVPHVRLSTVPDSDSWTFERAFARQLAGWGLLEAQNYSYLSAADAAVFQPGYGHPADATPVRIANPLSHDQAVLRMSLLPALLNNARLNFYREAAGVRLFEIGRSFYRDAEGPHETRRAGLVLAGARTAADWHNQTPSVDFLWLSALLEALAVQNRMFKTQVVAWRHPTLHPRRSAMLMAGKQVLAWFGELHPELQTRWDLRVPALVAELDLTLWRELSGIIPTYQPLPAHPPARRDLSFVVNETVAYEQLARVMRTAAGSWLESLALIDLYQGASIGAGKKSMTFSFVFRHPERTLDDNEIEKLMLKLMGDLTKHCQAVQRA